QWIFPQSASVIGIDSADGVQSLDEEAAIEELRGRRTAVARGHVEVAIAEPEDAERPLHQRIGRAAGVGRVGGLVRPGAPAGPAAADAFLHRARLADADHAAIGTLHPRPSSA